MKRFLVTGATGFLGGHLVERLLAKEDVTVRILCRGANRWTAMPRVEVVYGDILDVAVVERASREVDGIFHLAGFVTRDRSKASELFDIHIRGTRNLCESALRNGSPRIVVTSSSGTIAASHVPAMQNEDSPFTNEIAGRWPYYLSKIYQEKLAQSFHENHNLPVIIVSPSLLLGPGDERISSTGDVLLFLRRKITNVPNGGLNFVDVRDTADALIRAMDSGIPGRRYLIGGHNMTLKEFFLSLERLSGVTGPRLELPETWSRCGAAILRTLYKVVGKEFPLDDVTVEMAYRFWYFDNSRARSELGLNPRLAEETLKDTSAWLRERR
jgi:dihydroflavonol-4-reductase